MSSPDTGALALPEGTTLVFAGDRMLFSFCWRSTRGLHIVQSSIPANWQEPEHRPLLFDAVRQFNFAIALEISFL